MRGPRIDIPWYRRSIISKADIDNVPVPAFNFRLPKDKPNNPNSQPELSPEPAPQPETSPNPNPSTNPSPNPNPKIPISLPIEIPNAFPQNPTGQPFPIPKDIPVGNPFRRPGSKPATQPATRPGTAPRRTPVRRPVRTPAAAIDLLNPEIPFPEHIPQPWEIIPVGGLTPIKPNIDPKYLEGLKGYAENQGINSSEFYNYMIEYDYANFSASGMYSDLSKMYGPVMAAILFGYIIASIPLGIPGVPGI